MANAIKTVEALNPAILDSIRSRPSGLRDMRDDVIRARMRMSIGAAPGYAAIAVWPPGATDPQLLTIGPTDEEGVSHHTRVILWDTPTQARDWLPELGNGRTARWHGPDKICWLEFEPGLVNRAMVVTEYDPFDLPAEMPEGIRSESRNAEWRYHVMQYHVFRDVGQTERRSDGRLANLAIGE